MKDESNLPTDQQSLVFRLRKRAEIRRQISSRKSVQEGAPDRIADLLDEAAAEIERLQKTEHINYVTLRKYYNDFEKRIFQKFPLLEAQSNINFF